MKVDVEGSELRVLRGARRTLETLRPVVLLELNPPALRALGASVEDVLDLLDQSEYRIESLSPRRPVARGELTAGDTIADFVWSPRERNSRRWADLIY